MRKFFIVFLSVILIGGCKKSKEVELTGEAELSVSSSLPPDEEKGWTYDAENLRDKDRNTAWMEGAKGPGIGQWVSFVFPDMVTVTKIGIIPGYDRVEADAIGDRFYKNCRVKEIEVLFSDGEVLKFSLKDKRKMQYFKVPKIKTRFVKITITDAYTEGARWNDNGMSEVEIWGFK